MVDLILRKDYLWRNGAVEKHLFEVLPWRLPAVPAIGTCGDGEGWKAHITPEEIPVEHKRNIFHHENNQPLGSSPRGSGGSLVLGTVKVELDRVLGHLGLVMLC